MPASEQVATNSGEGMTRRALDATAIVMACLGLACTPARRTGMPASSAPVGPALFAGCYGAHLGMWSKTGAHLGLVPPETFALDTTHRADIYGRVARVVISPTMTAGGNRFASWDFLQDSLYVSWSNGLSSVHLRLATGSDTLRGIATSISDARFGLADPTAPIVAYRVSCR